MMFGIVGCKERRKTLIESSFVEGMRLTSTKLGAPDFGLWDGQENSRFHGLA